MIKLKKQIAFQYSHIVTIMLLFFLSVSVHAEAPINLQTETKAIIIPAKHFVVQRIQFTSREQTIFLRKGDFNIEGSALVSGNSKERFIESIKLKIKSELAYEEPEESKGGFLGISRVLKPIKRGRTMLELKSIELQCEGKTLAVKEFGIRIRDAGEIELPIQSATSNWSQTKILFHIRVCQDDSSAASIPDLQPMENRTIIWKPTDFLLEMKPAQNPGRPPKPGRLQFASPLSIFPPAPFIGSTFASSIILMNSGDIPTETATAYWEYGSETQIDEIPSIRGGTFQTLKFASTAQRDRGRVILKISNQSIANQSIAADFEPQSMAIPKLLSAKIVSNNAEEPLELIIAVANQGTGTADKMNIRLKGFGKETYVMLPPLRAEETNAFSFLWQDSFPESFNLDLFFINDEVTETKISFFVSRIPRPAPIFNIENIYFESDKSIGSKSRLYAVISNKGNLAGNVSPVLKASLEDIVISDFNRRIRIMPGETALVATEPFPLLSGLIRGDVLLGEKSEFILLDVPPERHESPEDCIKIEPLISVLNPNYSVMPIDDELKFIFAPVETTELDTVITIELHVKTWGSANEQRPVPAVTARLKGSGWQDKFEVASTETTFFSSLTRSMLEDTLELKLSPVGNIKAFLTDTPRLIGKLVYTENGVISNAIASESGVYLTLQNRGVFTKSNNLALFSKVSSAETTSIIKIKSGEIKNVFIPIASTKYGKETILLSLPNSPWNQLVEVTRFVPPVPFPNMNFSLLANAQSEDGENLSLVNINVQDGDAPDLEVKSEDEKSSEKQAITFVPAGETAVFAFKRANRFLVNYGPLNFSANLQEDSFRNRLSHLKILNLGDDTPPAGRDIVIRYARYAETGVLSAGRVYVAVNGILRQAQNVPQLKEGEKYYGGFKLNAGSSGEANIILFEELSPSFFLLDRFSSKLTLIKDVITRADRDWTLPVIVSTQSKGDVTERLANLAWEASRLLVEQGITNLPLITPQSALNLKRSEKDTSALGRIAYREALIELAKGWKKVSEIIQGARLPITLEAKQLNMFFSAIERLNILAAEPIELEQDKVSSALNELERYASYVIGKADSN